MDVAPLPNKKTESTSMNTGEIMEDWHTREQKLNHPSAVENFKILNTKRTYAFCFVQVRGNQGKNILVLR